MGPIQAPTPSALVPLLICLALGAPPAKGSLIVDADVPVASISVVDVPLTARDPQVARAADLRTLIALGFGTFVAALVFIIPPIFFPQMARELQVSVPLLGQILSVMLGLSVVLGLVIGPLSDRSGYRLLILIGLIAAAVCLLVFGLAPVFLLLLIASAAGAVTDAGVLGSSFAIAGTAFTGTAARRAIGWTSAAQAGSAIVAVPLLAAIGTVAGWRVAFIVAGLAALAVVALAALWLPRDHRQPAEPLRLDAILAPYRPLLRNAEMRRLYGATMVGAVCWFGVLTYLGAFLVEALGLGTAHVGVVYMAAGTGYCLGSLAVGGPLARVPTRLMVVFGYVATALLIALAFSARVGTPGSITLITGASLMMGMEGVAMTALLTAETPSGAGTTMTLNGSLFNLGATGGSAIGGALLALSGYQALAIGLPIFALGAALLSWRPAHSSSSPIRA
jgi:MFS transporter, DHA1 family, inner membrane transport protein